MMSNSILKPVLTGLLFLFLVHLTNAQNDSEISIKANNKPIIEVFGQIEKKTGFSFVYNNKRIDIEEKISINSSDVYLSDLLQQLSQLTGFNFQRRNQNILVYPSKKEEVITPKPVKKVTIGGVVKSKDSGEELLGATIYELKSKQGVITNYYGNFSLSVPEGDIILEVSYVGHESKILNLAASELNDYLVIELGLDELMQEVIVEGDRIEAESRSSQMGQIDIPVKQLATLPVIAGEVDVLRTLQLLPGVQSGSEGSTGLYVRGGGVDQNLYLLDGVPLYNVGHLGGFFSVFNADAISNVSLIKGGFPAKYGGRLSSVIDIKMKEGNNQEFHGNLTLGLISSKLSLEGPINKGKTSFIVSARRTYVDLFLKPVVRSLTDGAATWGYSFYDFNAKVNHVISSKDHLYLSYYGGDDRNVVKGNFNETGRTQDMNSLLAWGNHVGSFRWNHVFGKKLFSNLNFHYTRFRMAFDNESIGKREVEGNEAPVTINETFRFEYLSAVQDLGAKLQFDYFPTNSHHISFGAKYQFHSFTPGITTSILKSDDADNPINSRDSFGSNEVDANEYNIYAQDDWEVNDRIRVNFGAHVSIFQPEDTTYSSIQPRISARYLINPNLSFKASYASMQQNLHLLVNNEGVVPTDLWMPVTKRVQPQFSRQWSAGLAQDLNGGLINVSLEGYYKKMTDLIEYKEGAGFFNSNEDWQDNVETGGVGESYGLELLVKKSKGKLNGWFGYTISKSTRQFDEINRGEVFPFKYDRRHDVSIAANYKISERVSLSGSWVYGTGNAITLGVAKYASAPYGAPSNAPGGFTNPGSVHIYNGRNQFRAPAYHRLDFGIQFKKQKKFFLRTWSFSIYNVYSRANPYIIYHADVQDGNSNTSEYKQISIFPIIPTFSYKLSF